MGTQIVSEASRRAVEAFLGLGLGPSIPEGMKWLLRALRGSRATDNGPRR